MTLEVSCTDRIVSRTLRCHPQTSCAAVQTVVVEAELEPDEIVIRYRIMGDIERLRVPGPGMQLDPERLWAHTCCEMFVASPMSDAYVEWNFSPTGQIARFEFSSYRCRTSSSIAHDATAWMTVADDGLCVQTRVPLRPVVVGRTLAVGLSTVLEDVEGALSYWAMRHPTDRPDFHHRDGFALSLTHQQSWAVERP